MKRRPRKVLPAAAPSGPHSAPPAGIPSFFILPIVHVIIVVLAAAAIYGNSLHAPFVLDDVTSTFGNPVVRNFELSFKPRIVGDLTFALNYHLGGMSVFGYHMVNLLIHLINGLLVYYLVSLLLANQVPKSEDQSWSRLVSLFTALLFVCHPIQTQAITYISQRFASLATLFYLAAIVAWLTARGQTNRIVMLLTYSVSLVTAVLAMATKEIAVTLPLVILLLELVVLRTSVRRLVIPAALFSLAALLVPAAFLASSGGTGGLLQQLTKLATPTDVISRWDYLLTQFRVQATYLRLLFFPVRQNLDYDYQLAHTLSLPVVAGLALIIALMAGAVFLVVRARSGGQSHLRLVGFGILWFYSTLLVESSLIPLQDVIFEHRLYLPSVGAILAFVTGVMATSQFLRQQRRAAAAALAIPALVVVIVTFSLLTVLRNEVWSDEVTLWEDVVAKSPGKARPHGTLGSVYQKRGLYEEAAREYRTAIALDSRDAASHNNLATVLQIQKKWQEAAALYEKAVTLDPANAKARYNLGTVLIEIGRYEAAASALREAIRLRPEYDYAHNSLGIVYVRLLRNHDALTEFQHAVRLNPENREALGNLNALQAALGKKNYSLR